MKTIVCSVMLLLLSAGFIAVQAQVKEKKEIRTEAVVYEKARGADPNIITRRPVTDTKAPVKEKNRGDLCYIYINNYTPYAIDMYIDGDWTGTVAAYATAYGFAYPGSTKLYGKSVGDTYYWGPTYFDCQYEYTWNLWE